MLGLFVTVPIACFRKGYAREYLETELLPPPSTCYGFLLSLIGETDRARHVGAKVTAATMARTKKSLVLRTVWRVKKKPLGSPGNSRPDYQELLTGATLDHPFMELAIWLDSSKEVGEPPTLEEQVRKALDPSRRREISRFGGLSLGESTHLVDSVTTRFPQDHEERQGNIFLTSGHGRLTLPTWVDHVGSAGTRYATGSLETWDIESPPPLGRIPTIAP